MRKQRFFKTVVLLGIFFSLLASIYSLQRQIDTKTQHAFSDYLMASVPSGQYLKTAALGFDALIADLLWANTVVKVGEQVMTNRDHSLGFARDKAELYRRLDIITTLDPRFSEVYYFGSILLSLQADKVDESIMLLERAIENFPNDWRYYFNMGFNYVYYKNDRAKAIANFERAAGISGAPDYLSRLIGNLYADTGQIDMALFFLDEAYKRLPDQKMREEILEKMNDLVIEKHLMILEKAAEKYRHIYGKYPETLNVLEEATLIESLPTPPYGEQYIIDPQTGKVGVRSRTLYGSIATKPDLKL